MDLSHILLLLVAGLGGAYFFERNKRQSAEAIIKNKDVLDKNQELQAGVDRNNAALSQEEQNREEVKKKLADSKEGKMTDEELAKFFNDFFNNQH